MQSNFARMVMSFIKKDASLSRLQMSSLLAASLFAMGCWQLHLQRMSILTFALGMCATALCALFVVLFIGHIVHLDPLIGNQWWFARPYDLSAFLGAKAAFICCAVVIPFAMLHQMGRAHSVSPGLSSTVNALCVVCIGILLPAFALASLTSRTTTFLGSYTCFWAFTGFTHVLRMLSIGRPLPMPHGTDLPSLVLAISCLAVILLQYGMRARRLGIMTMILIPAILPFL